MALSGSQQDPVLHLVRAGASSVCIPRTMPSYPLTVSCGTLTLSVGFAVLGAAGLTVGGAFLLARAAEVSGALCTHHNAEKWTHRPS